MNHEAVSAVFFEESYIVPADQTARSLFSRLPHGRHYAEQLIECLAGIRGPRTSSVRWRRGRVLVPVRSAMPFHAAPALPAPMPGSGSLALGTDLDGDRVRTVPVVFVGAVRRP